MTQRKKLELPLNQPISVELLFDEPITGKSATGSYNLYAVKVDNDEFSFFAPDDVHSQLSKLSKGDKASITKLAAQRGSKIVTSFEVKTAKAEKEVAVEEEHLLEAENKKDRFFELMLNSYRDALKISQELNGMADPEKIAVTLFIARSKSLT